MDLNKFPFKIGDRFFIVQKKPGYDNITTFTAPCPACGDTREIKYMGVDGRQYVGKCPNCDPSGSYYASIHKAAGKNETVVRLYNFEVAEYIVSTLTFSSIYETKEAFKKPVMDDSIKLKHVEGFHKYGRADDAIDHHKFSPYFSDIIKPGETSKIESIIRNEFRDLETKVFLDKKDAEAVRKALVDTDKERVRKFNARFGTKFEYPWEDKR